MSKPAFTITKYGSTFRLTKDGWERSEPCNEPAPDGTACAYGKDHDGKHSWERR